MISLIKSKIYDQITITKKRRLKTFYQTDFKKVNINNCFHSRYIQNVVVFIKFLKIY